MIYLFCFLTEETSLSAQEQHLILKESIEAEKAKRDSIQEYNKIAETIACLPTAVSSQEYCLFILFYDLGKCYYFVKIMIGYFNSINS